MRARKGLFAGMRVAEAKPQDLIAATLCLVLAAIAGASSSGLEGWLASIGVAALFAGAAYALRGVDGIGAVAGAGLAFIFLRMGGRNIFFVLIIVFLLTWSATKIVRGPSRGRSAAQVTANLIVPSMVLMLPVKEAGVFAVAALAELAADTTSSEIGEHFGKTTYLLTTFHAVSPGTNGGVSVMGTFAGAVAAFLVGAAALSAGIRGQMGTAALAGFLGMFVDSLVGAILENKARLNNETVNLLGTGSAVGIACLLLEANR